MATIISFGTFNFDSSEVKGVSGSIEYPYIKISRLRSFTTLQIGARTTESIEIRALTPFAKFAVLGFMAVAGQRQVLTISGRSWGTFKIEEIVQDVRFDGQTDSVIRLGQVAAVQVSGDFTSLANSIGTFGVIDFLREELLDPIKAKLSYPTVVLSRLQNFPKVQDAEQGLTELALSLRFNSLYNTAISPIRRLDSFRALGDTYSLYNLNIKNVNYGEYVLRRIAWKMKILNEAGNAIAIDCDLDLLQSPSGVFIHQPKIFSFLVNNIERVTTLAPNLVSLTFQDPIDGGFSILELEFDAEAANLPVEGDLIRVRFGYDQEASLPNTNLLDTGLHKCDRPTRLYTPDIVRVGAQSYDYGVTLNSRQRLTYVNSSIPTILSTIGSQLGLTVNTNATTVTVGTANDTTSSVSISGNSYLEVLQQLALDYGYAFRIKFGTLSFQDYDVLDRAGEQFSVSPPDCTSADFTTKVKGTYRTAYFPAQSLTVISVVDPSTANNDSLDFRPSPFYRDTAAATRRSNGELRKYNRQKHEGTITIEGRPTAIAGINIVLFAFRNAEDNGRFQVNRAVHKLSATSGWQVELQIRKVFNV